ncbi:MAG: hypothetical protein HYY06_29820 [Deltaproteobacteria bacterium]|nr:hypothetical protein [Deltaproteobacteria bacterium]
MDERIPDREREDDSGSFVRGMVSDQEPAAPPDFLRGVQTKIRRRSRGKFFRNGWTTSPSATTVQIVSLAMLLALILIWILGGPFAEVGPDRGPANRGEEALPPVKIEIRGPR